MEWRQVCQTGMPSFLCAIVLHITYFILASAAIVLSSLRTSAGGGCPLFLAILLAASLFLGGVLPGAVRRSLSVLAMAAAVEEAPIPTSLFTSAFTSLSLSRLH